MCVCEQSRVNLQIAPLNPKGQRLYIYLETHHNSQLNSLFQIVNKYIFKKWCLPVKESQLIAMLEDWA